MINQLKIPNIFKRIFKPNFFKVRRKEMLDSIPGEINSLLKSLSKYLDFYESQYLLEKSKHKLNHSHNVSDWLTYKMYEIAKNHNKKKILMQLISDINPTIISNSHSVSKDLVEDIKINIRDLKYYLQG